MKEVIGAIDYHSNMLSTFPEVENMDIPGVDHFTEFHGIYFTFQPNLHSPIPGAGRWVLTDNITNPASANTAWYDDAYMPIYEALEDFKNKLNESKQS